jgi:hypothetical protein
MDDPLERAGLTDAAASVRAEWRADEEEWTRAAFDRWQHERSLLDVVRACMHRGDTVALHLAHATFTGLVCAVGDDLVGLALPDGRIDVRAGDGTAIVVRVLEDARAGGTRGADATTFRARLLELETGEQAVEVGCTAGSEVVIGRLQVGRDHVVVRDGDGSVTVVALAAVAWVRPAPD